MILRLAIGTLGIAGAAYGLVELLDLGLDNLGAATIWLVGGVVVHDGVLAPLTIGLCFLVARAWSRGVAAPVVTGLVVLASVTVVAIPVLGRFGARPDNPTLLDRDYVSGWLALATLTVLVVAATLVSSRARRRGTDGARVSSRSPDERP